MVTVYVLKGIKRYVGITNNLNRRLAEHKHKSSKGSQIIGEFKLVYTKEVPDYKTARIHEKFLKSGKGREWLDKFENDLTMYKDGQSQPEAGKACEPCQRQVNLWLIRFLLCPPIFVPNTFGTIHPSSRMLSGLRRMDALASQIKPLMKRFYYIPNDKLFLESFYFLPVTLLWENIFFDINNSKKQVRLRNISREYK